MSPQNDNIRLQEAKETLEDSLQYLVNDAKNYDKGNLRSIKRAAGTLRTLLYDPDRVNHNSNSQSLLKYLKVKNEIQMQSYVKPLDKGTINYNCLYFARFKDRRTNQKYYDTFLFYPKNSTPQHLSFDDWWNEKIITFNDVNNQIDSSITREQLIKVEANKDGIDHFDANIRGNGAHEYFGFKRGHTGFHITKVTNPLAYAAIIGGDYDPDETDIVGYDLNLALTRQVVHEVLISLLPYFDLGIEYRPDFNTNWNNKLNAIGWHLNVVKKE